MLLNDRRRPCSPTVVALIGLCFFMSIWHLSTFPNEVSPTTTNTALLSSIPSSQIASITSSQEPPAYEALTKEQAQQKQFDVQQLPMWDYTTLINLDEFVFDIINLPCNDTDKPPLLLILVHSAPLNFEKRQTIRHTWGQPHKLLRLLFILGRVENSKTQKQIENENQKYNDIIQGSFMDSYRNMTYKYVSALKYSIYHCPDARYVLKTDDDVFVNMPFMINFLSYTISSYGAKKLIYCTPYDNATPKRSYRSKWRVSFREYRGHSYPKYCPGWAVLHSPDVIFKLYEEAQRAEYFWIDDVHITGTLVQRANLTHTSSTLTLSNTDTYDLLVKQSNKDMDLHNNPILHFLFAKPNLSQNEIEKLWSIVQNVVNSNNNTLTTSTTDFIVT
ncbi:beta-1,3-galactosyltransferase 5 [Chrysoperla carnea]|uniref:beta-1,3-galactosyltransferase 5 n=1 Tax=Chrysoperla carnea TaxID=189513 RepID=UPI001D095981|nr:beta-1,3-galactosyltransferase 5 [Chrysoperla carnea]